MTIVNVANELDSSLVVKLADSVVTRLFVEIEKLSDSEVVDNSWLSSIKDLFVFAGNIETGFGHGRSFALAIIKKNWDKLPFDTRALFGYDFYNFARTWTGRERSTIGNDLNTAQVWFIDKAHPDYSIPVLERDNEGRPILDAGGNPRYNHVEFNPFLVPFSKLLICNSRAARGEITPRLWQMLMDNWFTCEDVRQEHVQLKVGDVPQDVYYLSMGTGIFLQHGSELVHIAELNWDEYESNIAVKEGIDRLLRLLHLRMDEDAMYEMAREKILETEKKFNVT